MQVSTVRIVSKFLLRSALVAAVSLVSLLAAQPARAQNYQIDNTGFNFVGYDVAIIGGSIAVAGIVVAIVIHEHGKKTVTGCVVAADNQLAVMDDAEKKAYLLTDGVPGVRPGEHLKLKLKKTKRKDAANRRMWMPTKLVRDMGGCAPAPVPVG